MSENIKKSEYTFIEPIKIINEAIKSNRKYSVNENKYSKIKKSITKSKFDLNDLVPLVIESMNDIGYNYNDILNEYSSSIKLRNSGHVFTFSEHLEALIMVQLYNDRWGDNNIRENLERIRVIFKDYNKEKLKNEPYLDIYNKLKKINCTNHSTKKQLKGLKQNIITMETIEEAMAQWKILLHPKIQ